jgi:hypothetical protein
MTKDESQLIAPKICKHRLSPLLPAARIAGSGTSTAELTSTIATILTVQ